METIRIGDLVLRIKLPASYETQPTRRFPLLLSLNDLDAGTCVASLHGERVLPEMIVAEVSDGSAIDNPAEILAELSGALRLLETPAARWIVGTGLQGVLALETLLDHSEAFGAAACLSPSFEGIEGAPPLHSKALHRMEARTTLPAKVRLYCDYGTVGLDECYEPYHRDLAAILRSKEWCEGSEFTIVRSIGGTHTSESWRERLAPALRWLAQR